MHITDFLTTFFGITSRNRLATWRSPSLREHMARSYPPFERTDDDNMIYACIYIPLMMKETFIGSKARIEYRS